MLRMLKPPLRAVKYGWLRWYAAWRVRRVDGRSSRGEGRVAFVFGCGRSGTTILGIVLSKHRFNGINGFVL